VRLEFPAPAVGAAELKVFLVSADYVGCDQEYGVHLLIEE
jgi:hypothetical protein